MTCDCCKLRAQELPAVFAQLWTQQPQADLPEHYRVEHLCYSCISHAQAYLDRGPQHGEHRLLEAQGRLAL